MTGPPELLEAIYEDPDDLAAWRVYADWLVDRGDPLGEPLLLACTMEVGPQRRLMAMREERLDEWVGAALARALRGDADPTLRRQFEAGELTLSEFEYASSPDAAAEWHGPFVVEAYFPKFAFDPDAFVELTHERVGQFLRSMQLRLPRELEARRRLRLSQLPRMEALTELEIIGGGYVVVADLLRQVPRLTRLRVQDATLDLRDFRHQRLQSLDISGATFNQVRPLLEGELPRLTALSLTCNAEMASAQLSLPALQRLKFNACRPDILECLARSPAASTIEHFSLNPAWDRRLVADCVAVLADRIGDFPRLRRLFVVGANAAELEPLRAVAHGVDVDNWWDEDH